MKIKRYFAADMRTALARVREEQGPEAVILSNRRVDGGVEIMAAVDFDEAALRQRGDAQPPRPAPVAVPSRAAGPATTPAAFAPGLAPSPGPVSEGATTERELAGLRREVAGLRSLLLGQMAELTWGREGRQQPQLRALVSRLRDLGFSSELADELAQATLALQPQAGDAVLASVLRGRLASLDPSHEQALIERGGVAALVGPTGVGKTTTIAKIAARYALTHGSRGIALITTDHYRIGAREQLNIYGRLLGVPVHLAADREELAAVLDRVADRELVLIDTAGMSQRDLRLADSLETLDLPGGGIQTYLALSATADPGVLREAAANFACLPLAGCVLTKLDEAVRLGPLLDALIRAGLPPAYVSDGQRVPEDLHPARADRLIELALADNGPTEDHQERVFAHARA